ncbi:MAG: hypothetical protein DMG37_12410 [Acidobacteria bacterium]|nr:MAG: hypothetical protein DMG37_12410 [Acidobacteriota bacterium]
MVIAFSFPICPAGIVFVTRVPCAVTPPMVCVPRSSLFKLAPAFSPCWNSFLSLIAWFMGPFILAKDFSIFSAVLWSGCNMKVTRATGSLMTTNDFGCSEVARGPNPVSVISLRMRPWLSRKTLVCVFRVM